MTFDIDPGQNHLQDIVYSFAAPPGFDLNQPDTGPCFAARSSGLYSSIDGGSTWQGLLDSLKLEQDLPVLSLAVSPAFRSDKILVAGVPGGLLLSEGGGDTWRVISFPSPPPLFSAVVLSPAFMDDGVGLSGSTEDGIFRTDDRGQKWPAANFGLLDLKIFCLQLTPTFQEDEIALAGTESGIFRSTNGGRAWREVSLPFDFETILSLACSPDFAHDHLFLAGMETKGLIVSTDGGQTWEQPDPLVVNGSVDSILFSPKFPNPADILIVNEGRLFLSRDAGKSWSAWLQAETGPGVVTAVFAPQGFNSGSALLVGMGDGRILRINV
jgi:photosystem II stability/assembly factor-like uncharacterized protein